MIFALLGPPVCDPLPNLTLEHERLSGSLLRQKLLQFPHCGMKLQIVSYKRNDSTLPDLLEKLRDAFERFSEWLLDKHAAYVRQAALDCLHVQAGRVANDRHVGLQFNQFRPIA